MTRLLACGGRDYRDAATVARTLERIAELEAEASEWRARVRRRKGTLAMGPFDKEDAELMAKDCLRRAKNLRRGYADMVRRCEAAGVKVWRVGWGNNTKETNDGTP